MRFSVNTASATSNTTATSTAAVKYNATKHVTTLIICAAVLIVLILVGGIIVKIYHKGRIEVNEQPTQATDGTEMTSNVLTTIT